MQSYYRTSAIFAYWFTRYAFTLKRMRKIDSCTHFDACYCLDNLSEKQD